MTRLPIISERDLAEATSVTTGWSGQKFEIQLGHLCNDRCVFCSSGELTRRGAARRISLEPIVAAMQKARAEGARHVTFLGGEPTIHKEFIPALRRAVELGFDEIVIFTNGVMLPHPGFIDSVVELGKQVEWRISIQGGNEAAHVAVTGRPQSFRRIVLGLERLAELGQRVTANMCISEPSYRSLPDYPELVERYGIRQLHVDIIRPSSAGPREEGYLRRIMPRYSDVAPYLRSMLEGFQLRQPGFDVNIGNLPFCILPEWSDRIRHGGDDTTTTASDETGLEAPVDKYAWHASLRRHLPACEGCVFLPQCTGVFAEYLQVYADAEFRAVSHEQLRAVDRDQRGFVALVEPLIAPLLDDPPPGWTVDLLRAPQERRIDLRYAKATATITLSFVCSPTQNSVWTTDQFALEVSVDGDLDLQDLARVVGYAARNLEKRVVTTTAPSVERLRVLLRERAADIQWLEITPDYECNNRCVGCFSVQDGGPRMDTREVVKNLLEGRRRGATLLWLGGGEPTLRRDLVGIVARARALGYERVKLQTNGMMLAYPEVTEKLAGAGVTEVSFSIKGATAATHDRLTRTPGCHELMVQGMKRCRQAGLRLEGDILAYESNVGELVEMVQKYQKLGLEHFNVWLLSAKDQNEAAVRDEVPKIADLMRNLTQAMDLGVATITSLHTPPCAIARGYEACSFQASDLKMLITNPGGYAFRLEQSPMEGGAYLPGCAVCSMRQRCGGLREDYLAIHGDAEFVPVRNDD